MSTIHLELLDSERRTIFAKLAAFKPYGYLGGGTALALQINHRKSFDFDIFTEKSLSNRLRRMITKVFRPQFYSVNSEDQITFSPHTRCGVTFLWYYWKPIAPRVVTDSLSLAAVVDIAADKAHTLGRRAVWRDYVDLFFLMKEQGMTVQSIISAAEKKFRSEFVKTQFIEQLSYFGDVTVVPIEFVRTVYTPEEVKSYLEQQVTSYLKSLLPI